MAGCSQYIANPLAASRKRPRQRADAMRPRTRLRITKTSRWLRLTAWLEALVDPLRGLVSSEHQDGNQRQGNQHGVEILAAEELAQHGGLVVEVDVTAHAPLAVFFAGHILARRQVQLLQFAVVVEHDLARAIYQGIGVHLRGFFAL